MNKEEGKILKVTLEFEGVTKQLIGKDAEQWLKAGEALSSVSYARNPHHKTGYEGLNWIESNNQDPKTSEEKECTWCNGVEYENFACSACNGTGKYNPQPINNQESKGRLVKTGMTVIECANITNELTYIADKFRYKIPKFNVLQVHVIKEYATSLHTEEKEETLKYEIFKHGFAMARGEMALPDESVCKQLFKLYLKEHDRA